MATLTGPISQYNPVTAASNQTTSTCCICLEDYMKSETEKVRKVVEINCGHYFHVDCLKGAARVQETYNEGLSCCYCRQLYAYPIVEHNNKPLTNKSEFLKVLQQIRDDYAYDETAIAATFCIQELFDPLSTLTKDHAENPTAFIEAIRDLICNAPSIKDELKGNALMVISAMISQGGCLRSLKGEARRWAGVPIDKYPESLRTRGVMVCMEGTRVRISAKYLHRASAEILLEDIADEIKERGDYIASLPGKVVSRIHEIGTFFIRSLWDTIAG